MRQERRPVVPYARPGGLYEKITPCVSRSGRTPRSARAVGSTSQLPHHHPSITCAGCDCGCERRILPRAPTVSLTAYVLTVLHILAAHSKAGSDGTGWVPEPGNLVRPPQPAVMVRPGLLELWCSAGKEINRQRRILIERSRARWTRWRRVGRRADVAGASSTIGASHRRAARAIADRVRRRLRQRWRRRMVYMQSRPERRRTTATGRRGRLRTTRGGRGRPRRLKSTCFANYAIPASIRFTPASPSPA